LDCSKKYFRLFPRVKWLASHFGSAFDASELDHPHGGCKSSTSTTTGSGLYVSEK
jgi:hypothetical protein